MEFITHIITSAAFYAFVYTVLEQLFSARIKDLGIRLAAFSAAAGGMIGLSFIGEPLLNVAYSFISAAALNLLLYAPNDKKFILYDIIIVIFSAISDMLSKFLLSLILNIKIEQLINDEWKLLSIAGMYSILLFSFCQIFNIFIRKRNVKTIRYQELIFFIVLFCGEMLFLRLINDYVVLSEATYELAVILLALLALDLYLAYLLNKLSQRAICWKSNTSLSSSSRAYSLRRTKISALNTPTHER